MITVQLIIMSKTRNRVKKIGPLKIVSNWNYVKYSKNNFNLWENSQNPVMLCFFVNFINAPHL